jgi:TDG/mug DNA glycosylase family protein
MTETLHTLPDLVKPGLDIIFVGINPSLPSAATGHYFARRTNRFWPGFSRSVLSLAARTALGVDQLEPIHDQAMLDYGIGFTDLVKRPTAKAADLAPAEFVAGVAGLVKKVNRYKPRIACFHGVTVFRPIQRVLAPALPDPMLGLQALTIGTTKLFVVPNPSPANAHFTPADETRWYDLLAAALAET